MFRILLFAAVALVPLLGMGDEPVDTLVLCPTPFRQALQPWVEYREQQGHRLLVIPPAASSFAVQEQVRQAAKKYPLHNLVIIGDATSDTKQVAGTTVPTDYKIAMGIVQFGGEPDIATDNSYADIDGDDVVDLTLGRIPVDTPQQLTEFIDKVIAYETKADFGPWRRKINLIAGVGNFDPVIDKVIENASKQMITDLIPPCYETSMTWTSWQSAYCPNPQRLASTVVDRMNEGCLFWVYIGHGLATSVAPMRVGRMSFPVFDSQIACRANATQGSPIAVFLACYSGAFDRKKDCLGETLVCQPCGPVACLCGSRMTMPYGMATLSYEVMDEFFKGEHETLGDVILFAKQNLARNHIDNEYREMIEDLGESFSPRAELLPIERYEHLHMFHLLGDPLLRVPRPGPLELHVDWSPTDPATARVHGVAPEAGSLVLDLAYKRDRLRYRPERRKSFDPSREALARYDETYRRSNDLICTSETIQVGAGSFSAELRIPADASGECHIRGFLSTGKQAWAQAVPIDIPRQTPGSAPAATANSGSSNGRIKR